MNRAAAALLVALLAVSGAAAQGSQADATALYRSGRELLARGDLFRAIETLMAATDANPAYADAWLALAECQYELGEYGRALNYLAEAQKYGPRAPSSKNLEAFSLIGLGRVDEAAPLFESVLQSLPNDRDARFGLALLDVRSGRTADARARLSASLKAAPRDSRALLSLALITRAEGLAEQSALYLAEALRWASGDADVCHAAAVLALENGQRAEAARLARSALDLKPGHADARSLLASVYFEDGRLDEARALLRASLAANRDDTRAWYILGLVENAAGNYPEAEYALGTLCDLRPDDEIARLALEQLVMDGTGFEDPTRAGYAAWRFDRAAEFARAYRYDRALEEYRRGLALDPYANQGRRKYADLLRLSGLPSTYLSELSFLHDLGKADQALMDALEIYQSFLEGSVASEWNADTLALYRKPYALDVYAVGPGGAPWHTGSDLVIARYARDRLVSSAQIAPRPAVSRVDSFADAYSLSRASGSDYFLIVRSAETERDILVYAELRASKSGSLVARVDAPRSGNDRVALAVERVVAEVGKALALRGVILDRSGDRALADFGRADGVQKGDRFLVIRAGAVSARADGAGLSWSDADIVAKFEVTRVDDDACEGKLERVGFFDKANPRDVLVRELEEAEGAQEEAPVSPAPDAALWTTLFDRVRRLF